MIGLRGGDIDRKRVKEGDYVGREVKDPQVRFALFDYLENCGRIKALDTNGPLWNRHDWAGKPGAQLTSHAFAHNLKRYAK